MAVYTRAVLRPALVLTLLFASATAGAQLSARVRMVARGQLPAAAIGTPGHAGALVTVRLRGGAARLASLGLPAHPLTTDVAAAELGADAIAYLAAALPGEPLAIEERRLLHPLLDRAAALIGAPAARAASGLSGRGVLVGVVDTGVDLRHADLRAADGHTRLLAVLDQSQPADARHADLGDYAGAIWLKDEIDALLDAEAAGLPPPTPITQVDDQGHGTHVASIAAGNGLGTGNGQPAGRYLGIAPEADLLAARVTDPSGEISDVGVLTACRFLVDRAAAIGEPLVVNFSLGTGSGPHDGSTNFEVAFDEIFPRDQPGRAVVVAAGNGGGHDLHAGGLALDGEIALPLELRDGDTGTLALELWYDGGLDVALETPDGRRTDWVAPGQSGDTTLDGQARVLIDNSGARATGARRDAALVLQGAGAARPSTGRWTLHLRGRSLRYDAWIEEGGVAKQAHFVDRIVADDRLAVPATATSAIAVGSLVSRLDWPTVDGRTYSPMGADPTRTGGPSFFSSPGPTADGRFAPDVAAPGEYVIAAMSRDATPDHPTSVFRADPNDLNALVADDGVHGVLRGTSQATPMVTGAIALLLQAAPTLTSEQLREVLRVTAAAVDGTAGWSPRVGFGRIDVPAALEFLRGVRGTIADPIVSTVGVSRDLLPPDSDETTTVTVTPRDAAGHALGGGHAVAIELSAGAAQGGVVDRGGRYERVFVAHAARGVRGDVTVTVDGVALAAHPVVWFVPSRAEAGGALTPGGGCAVAPGGPLPVLGLGAALVLLALLRRRRS
jgi:MYXO-CTERM domain-containing protein